VGARVEWSVDANGVPSSGQQRCIHHLQLASALILPRCDFPVGFLVASRRIPEFGDSRVAVGRVSGEIQRRQYNQLSGRVRRKLTFECSLTGGNSGWASSAPTVSHREMGSLAIHPIVTSQLIAIPLTPKPIDLHRAAIDGGPPDTDTNTAQTPVEMLSTEVHERLRGGAGWGEWWGSR